jgi:hypothetical protein
MIQMTHLQFIRNFFLLKFSFACPTSNFCRFSVCKFFLLVKAGCLELLSPF